MRSSNTYTFTICVPTPERCSRLGRSTAGAHELLSSLTTCTTSSIAICEEYFNRVLTLSTRCLRQDRTTSSIEGLFTNEQRDGRRLRHSLRFCWVLRQWCSGALISNGCQSAPPNVAKSSPRTPSNANANNRSSSELLLGSIR